MRDLLDRVVFQAGTTQYLLRDVLLAAALWGDWRLVVRRAELGATLLQEAEASGEAPITDEDVESAANEFRYARNLVTADEMESWLASWNLDVEGWIAWVTADLLRRAQEGDPPPATAHVPPEELDAAVWAEAVFSGTVLRVAHRLTEEVAVSDRLEEAGGTQEPLQRPGGTAGEPFEISPELRQSLDSLVLDLSEGDLRDRLGSLSRLDRAFEGFKAAALDETSLSARLKVHQTDWTKVKVRTLRFASEDAAREALISIRDDGCQLDEVAADAGAELVEGSFFLERFEPAIRDHLLGAPPGALLGPLRDRDEWVLFSVEAKQLASLDDQEIRSRAERDLLQNVVGREVDNRISWRWGR